MKKKTRFLALIAALVAFLLLAGGCTGNKQDEVSSKSDEETGIDLNVESTDEDKTDDETADEVEEDESSDVSGTLSDYYVTIGDVEITSDYSGNPVLLVEYSFTNNSDSETMFSTVLKASAYQDDVELSAAVLVKADGYDAMDTLKNIRPGGSITFKKPYTLRNKTSEVEIVVDDLWGDLFKATEDKLTKTVDLSEI